MPKARFASNANAGSQVRPRVVQAIAGLALNAEEPVTGWGRGRRRHAVARAVRIHATNKGGTLTTRRVVARPRRPRFAVKAEEAPWHAAIVVRVAVTMNGVSEHQW